MAGTWLRIEARDGGAFKAYLSAQAGGRSPGVALCTEVFGVNPHMRSVADRLAAQGYTVIVPDLFWRIEPGMEIPYDEAGLKRGSEILAQFDMDRGVEDLGAAVQVLRERPECTGKVGALGFCLGGALAYLAGTRLGVEAAVGYYGKGITERLDEARRLKGPLVLHFGGADRFIPMEEIDRIREAIGGLPNVSVYVYPGVNHGFNSEDRRAYDAAAAATAMQRTLATFQAALA